MSYIINGSNASRYSDPYANKNFNSSKETTLKPKAPEEGLSYKVEVLANSQLKYGFKNGKREGEAIQKFENGDVLTFQYKAGKKDGLATRTFSNGYISK